MSDGILTAEQVQGQRLAWTVADHHRLCDSHERLREQRDDHLAARELYYDSWRDSKEKVAQAKAALERIVWLRISDPPAQVVAREALALLEQEPDA